MSRSAAQRSRIEKSRIITPAVSSPQVDIVPGRFSENDWQVMVANEDSEIHIGDIIDDIVNQALDACYRVYIEKQLLPFTIAQAKEAILQIIEWQFLTHDSGERAVLMEQSWQEDEEPVAYITDSWAQGSVPLVKAPSTATLEKQERLEETPGDTICLPKGIEDPTATPAGPECWSDQQPHQEVNVMSSVSKELMGHSLDSEKEGKKAVEVDEDAEPQSPPVAKKRILKYGCHRGGPSKRKSVPRHLCQTEKELLQPQTPEPCVEEPPVPPCDFYRMTSYFQNVLKIQNSRRPLNNIMTFDKFGNVTAVQRLKPSQFPRQHVRPVFQLLDVELEPETHRPLLREALRPLVFRGGNFTKGLFPARYNVRRPQKQVAENREGERSLGGEKTGLQGSHADRQPGRAAPLRRLKLNDSCAVSNSPEFIDFIPDGAKDRNHSNRGHYPEYEETQQSRLRPICNSLFRPPILVEYLTSSIVQ
ncbi:uncharacterized protein C2orf81 homolog [Scyliorhinus canicula]|uniref:uncharacterized protein C2orf81 homolog n=1 Tax=Scyliorhinus canicula TaxID=7830 RepID=UPI0018F38260|nr:uncharacterized protein C2orf81 homolog [Scyliorhinus canicula]